MSDFKAKMHQIRFPAGGAYSAPPDLLAGFEVPTSKGKGGKRGGNERGGEGGEGKGEETFLVMWPRRLSALNPPLWRTYWDQA